MGVNDVTGDSLISKGLSEQGKANWDSIFGEKPKKEPYVPPPLPKFKECPNPNGCFCDGTCRQLAE